jgi:hypothetical protein
LCFVVSQFWVFSRPYAIDKKVVGVFVRFLRRFTRSLGDSPDGREVAHAQCVSLWIAAVDVLGIVDVVADAPSRQC